MPTEESYTDLGLIGINAGLGQNSEQPTIYSPQLPLEPGFHLRWQLRQGLGLPERFVIYSTNRRFFESIYTDNFDGGFNLTPEAVAMGEAGLLDLLKAEISNLTALGQATPSTTPVFALNYYSWNALQWLTDTPRHRGIDPDLIFPPSPYSSTLQEKYAGSYLVEELTKMIDNLRNTLHNGQQQIGLGTIYAMHQQVIEQAEPGKSFRTSLKRMDALNLAALDPHFARMAGFYFIDRQQINQKYHVGYFVVADYGSQEYPFTTLTPKREAVLWEFTSEMRFEGLKVIALGGSFLHFSAPDAQNLGLLTAFSGLNPAIRFVFDEPTGIGEVIVNLRTTGSIAVDFVASDGWYGHDGIFITPLQNGALQIRATQRGPNGSMLAFKNLDIKGTGAGSLVIEQVQFKRRVGPIGLIKSNPIILGDGIGEEKIQPLLLGKAFSEPLAPILNDEGYYDPFRSNLKLSLIQKAHSVNPAHPNFIASNSPVRAIFDLTNPNGSHLESDKIIIGKYSRVLPELVLYAPLSSNTKNHATGQALTILGNCSFVKDNPIDDQHSTLLITGDGGVLAMENAGLWSSQVFTISLRLKIGADNPANEHIPLVNLGGEQGVGLGFRHLNGSLFWRLKLGGVISESPPITLQLNTWWRINLFFDNGKVIFNGADGTQIASQPVPLVGAGIAIGMDFDPILNQVTRSFKGQVCDVQIWNKLISTYDADFSLRENARDFPKELLPTSFFSLPQAIFCIPDIVSTLRTETIPILSTLNAGFSCHFWLLINNDDGAVLLSDASRQFRFGVDFSGGFMYFDCDNAHRYTSTNAPQEGKWVHIGFSIAADTNGLRFYIDGNLDSEVQTEPISFSGIQQPICFGGEPRGDWMLNGGMADIRFYPYAVAPKEVVQDFATWQLLETNIPDGHYEIRAKGIDLFGRLSPLSHLMPHHAQSDYTPNPPASLKAEILSFKAIMQGAVLRRAKQSNEKPPIWEVRLQPNPDLPDAILNALARHSITITKEVFRTLTNTRPDPPAEGTPPGPPAGVLVRQQYEVINKNEPQFRNDYEGINLDSHVLYLKDVPFAQVKPGEAPLQTVLIEYDARVNLRWEWTGLQQIFNPGVTRFQTLYKSGLLNDWQGKVTAVSPIENSNNRQFRVQVDTLIPGEANALNGEICLIDHRAYVITNHTGAAAQTATFELRYDGYPILAPEIGGIVMLTLPEKHSAWRDFSKIDHWNGVQAVADSPASVPNPDPIRINHYQTNSIQLHQVDVEALKEDKNIDWLPADTTWRLRLTNSDAPKPNHYVELEPNEYVTSALVVYCKTDNPNQGTWNTWYVLWHEWTDTYLDFYITVADQNQHPHLNNASQELPDEAYFPVPPTELLQPGSQIRFYPGQAFTQKVVIRPPGDGESPVLSWHFAVASMAQVISPLSLKASVVAVERRFPVEPNRPIITSIGLADVYGNSLAQVSWEKSEGVYGYNLYRATDTAIFDRDLENRRLKLGFYAEEHVAIGDADFAEFLRAVRHKDQVVFAPGFQTAFGKSLNLLEESDLYGRDKVKYGDQWNALTPIWQYWADRFYPALNDSEKEAIANRKGNETAFTLVNHEPIRKEIYADPERRDTHVKYPDTVNGVVSNQYFYRLRTVASNMALGSTWSRVSNGMGVSIPAARPRTPVWTKVEAGDRQVTLQWALNREPDFKEYILYRATNKDLLNDVRWAEVEQPEGLVVRRIKDPRILTSIVNRESLIVFTPPQTPPPISAIVGIYRAFEFDNKMVGEQLGAMNLKRDITQVRNNEIRGIGKVAKGTEIVMVLQMGANMTRKFDSFDGWPLIDKPLIGARKYSYKLVAVSKISDALTNSLPSSNIEACAFEESLPLTPKYGIERVNIDASSRITLHPPAGNYDELEISIKRKFLGEAIWRSWRNWTSVSRIEDHQVTTADTVFYQFIIRSKSGKIGDDTYILISEPV